MERILKKKTYTPLTDVPEVPENVLRENDFRLMFINCPSIKFMSNTTNTEVSEQEKISEPKKFDDFDWDDDFANAYKD